MRAPTARAGNHIPMLNRISWWVRIVSLSGLALIAVVAVMHEAGNGQAEAHLFSESSVVEHLQVGLLVLAFALSLMASRAMNSLHRFDRLIGILPILMVIRELDYWLDTNLFDGAWQLLATLTLLVFGTWAWPHRKTLARMLGQFLCTREGGLLMGSLVSLAFSRLFGMKALWDQIMGESFNRSVKNAAEECTELLAYYLIVATMLELAIRRYREAAADTP